jgi:hypothetical protein
MSRIADLSVSFFVTLHRHQRPFNFESICVIPSRPPHTLAPLFAVCTTAGAEQAYHFPLPLRGVK